MVKILRGLAVVLFLLHLFAPLSAAAESETPAGQILISEFQTGSIDAGTENPKGEFVELYNSSGEAVLLEGWKLDYLTKTHDGVSAATRTLATLSGTLDPGSYLLISYEGYLAGADFSYTGGPSTGYLAKGDGSIRLSDSSDKTVDLVGYGSPNNFEEQPADAPDAGKSSQRCYIDESLVDTDNNGADFAIYESVTLGTATECPVSSQPEPTDSSNCDGIIFSELLPNPAGTDSGHEFIELYNPTTDFINLSGCGLQFGSITYRFGSIELAPEQYKAFYDTATGVTLTNSSGGTVYLLSGIDEELDAVTYAGGLADDVAWAWFGDWHQTYSPTPNAINADQPDKPCGFGQIRNPDTGRCISLGIGGSNLTPCRADQERNPATNRCRLKTVTASQLTPCKSGQERNPETNRCRKIASSNLKPCKPGQQRNPATNRCRNSALAGSSGSGGGNVQDIASPNSPTASWWLTGLILFGATGYGIWEWRSELLNLFRRGKQSPA